MQMEYTLNWLDELVLNWTHNDNTQGYLISDLEFQNTIHAINCEKRQQYAYIRQTIFQSTSESEIQAFLSYYYGSINHLCHQANLNYSNRSANQILIKKLDQHLISCLMELLTFMYGQFADYISVEQAAPISLVLISKTKWQKFITNNFESQLDDTYAIKNHFYEYLKTWLNFNSKKPVTIRELQYYNFLLTELSANSENISQSTELSEFENFLLFTNFNNRIVFSKLTQKISDIVNRIENTISKLERLLCISKQINQQIEKTEMGLISNSESLKTLLGNWIGQEIIYFEKRIHLCAIPVQEIKIDTPIKKIQIGKIESSKVMCLLTVDQMAIALRAADEMKLLMARSLSAVFNQIVPYLSSPYKEVISSSSMRSKSYSPEERDKLVVIQTLQKLIEKIEDY